MRAIRIHENGGPEVMRLEELPTPEPGEGQVRVNVDAAGVNFIDIYQRSGAYKLQLPLTLGLEGAGTVDTVGPGVSSLEAGDRVAWNGVPGSYASQTLVPADKAVKLPEGVSAERGAAIMLQGMTAHYLAHSTYSLQPGDTCLIHAAAGGVGLLLCQIAKLRGARVIGTVSTEEKAALARKAGADEVILYSQQDFEPEVKRLTDGKGCAVVYDSVGKDTFDRSLNCLRPRGVLALFGQSSGAVSPVDPQVLAGKGSLFLTRPTLVHYTLTREEIDWRAQDLFGWIKAGKLDVRIGGRYPLAEVGGAHEDLAARRTTGKLILTV
jgi:NADPH2:quinone reductase